MMAYIPVFTMIMAYSQLFWQEHTIISCSYSMHDSMTKLLLLLRWHMVSQLLGHGVLKYATYSCQFVKYEVMFQIFAHL